MQPHPTTGNILFLIGFPFMIGAWGWYLVTERLQSNAPFLPAGFSRTLDIFNPIKRPTKLRGIVLFFLGVALVLFRWTFFGIIIEVAGMVSMFAPFLSIVVLFLRNTPVVGPFFSLPIVATIVDKLAGSSEKRAPV